MKIEIIEPRAKTNLQFKNQENERADCKMVKRKYLESKRFALLFNLHAEVEPDKLYGTLIKMFKSFCSKGFKLLTK
jgi:hypothetical protein